MKVLQSMQGVCSNFYLYTYTCELYTNSIHTLHTLHKTTRMTWEDLNQEKAHGSSGNL